MELILLLVKSGRTDDFAEILAKPKNEIDSIVAHLRELSATSDRKTRLAKRLRDLRRELANDLGKTPFGIFDDFTLDRLIDAEPNNEIALSKIKGISAERLRSYGDRIVAAIVRNADPSANLPDRPEFISCASCNKLQVLAIKPTQGTRFLCKACNASKDVRLIRGDVNRMLPKARDYE